MEDSRALNQQVLSSCYELQANLTEQIAAIKSSQYDTAAVLRYFENMQASLQQANSLLSSALPGKDDTRCQSEMYSIAESVMQIPKLLEIILENCDAFSIINMRSTCRTSQDIIDASPKMQTKLLLRPNGECALADMLKSDNHDTLLIYHPLANHTSWFSMDDEYLDDLNIFISFHIPPSTHCLPKVGEKWKQMLISQPPVTKVDIWKYCKGVVHPEYGPNADPETFGTGDPLRFGDLYDKATEIFSDHKDCVRLGCSEWGRCKYVSFECFVPDSDD